MSRRWMVLVVVMAMALFGGACGSDDDADTATGAATGTAAEEAAEPAEHTIGTMESADNKFAFESVPATVEGGAVAFTLDNSDGKEPHDFQIAKLTAGHTVEELMQQLESNEAPLADWITEAAGVGHAAPGKTVTATVDLTEGEWAYFCTESSGEEGKEVSHAKAGMKGTFKVEGASEAELPETEASIEMVDYGFTTSGLKAGTNEVKLTNTGKQIHHALLIPIVAGKTFDDAKKFATSQEEPQGPPPVDFEKGVGSAVFGGGRSGVVTFDLAAGNYALICFMPDKGTAGPPHAAKGMIVEVKVT